VIYAMAEYDFEGQESGYIKIGFVDADDVDEAIERIRRRLIDLQQGNPRRLAVIGIAPGTRVHEKALHQRFDSDRVKRPTKSEWVHVSDAVRAWLDVVRLEESIMVGHAVGRGSRGGPVEQNLGLNRCRMCGDHGHNAARCVLNPMRLLNAENARNGIRRRVKTFEWRGKVRVA
jgi:hypothetical protein